MTEWISVKDILPDRLISVLGHMKDGGIYVVCQCDWDDVCDYWHFMPQPDNFHRVLFDELTHWMPLPEAPK